MSLRPAVLLVATLLLAPRPGLSQDAPPKVAGVDVPAPKRTKSIPPHYPPEAQALGMRGIVILELLVGPDGKVASARVTRSVPPFDEAALSAVRQWEYEVTRVEGQPVSVILTVPIEFKMRLPEMTREDGIPELRQGVVPGFPVGAGADAATVTAEVSLDPDGHVAEAHIKNGESPWAESVIQALRTWRFSPVEGGAGLVFEVRADFAGAGKNGPRVDLRLSGGRRVEAPPATADASPSPSPSPSPETEAAPSPSPVPPSAPAIAPAPVTAPTPAPAPAATPSPAPVPPPAPVPSPSPSPAVPRPTPPPVEVIRNPAGGAPATPPATPPSPAGATPETTAPSPAAVAATPAPPTPGISAVRDVTLAPGVPDLVKGRRPMAPPLARMQGVSGTVDVRFAVDAAGSATVREVNGPDLLKEAARQTVASWSFRRATPERLFLAAIITYQGDTAAAAVKPQE